MKTILAHLYYNSFFDNGQWISKQWDNWWGKGDNNQLINFWVACDYNGTNKKENNGAIYDENILILLYENIIQCWIICILFCTISNYFWMKCNF